MENLKNCMFCKSDQVEAFTKTSAGAGGKVKVSVYVKCHNCRARGPSFSGAPRNAPAFYDLAVYGWNNAPRVVPSEDDEV